MFWLFFPLVGVAFVGERSPLRRIGWPLLFLLAGGLLALGPWPRSVWIATDIGQEKSYMGGMNAVPRGAALRRVVTCECGSSRVRTALLSSQIIAQI